MKPYHWESHHGNFGDDLNLWLWDFLLPGLRDVHPDVLLVGVGTVLNDVLFPPGQRKLVIGSGYGYGAVPDTSTPDLWDIRCVRGEMTAAKLGLPPEKGIVDPAVMVTEMPEFQNLQKIYKKTFVPHWESAEFGMWDTVCEPAGLTYLDPRGEAKSVIKQIAQSEMIVAESMHGAILADAFRVPWVAVSTSQSINSFKWSDWAGSVGVAYEPRYIPVSTRAEAAKKGSKFWGISFPPPPPPVIVEHTSVAPHDDGDVLVRAETQRPLRKLAKQVLAAPSILALWQASRAEPRLSPGGRLEERKERFQAVLETVKRDYF
ncbi:polysaccharide pyruvyl transferase family protein [Rhizobium rhizogenes]|uniref:Succinoglycan biosynthesis protein exov n=1 Tax=Rhizobium rhizogenes TaxID=359 RepID=A0AA92C493_RHIRH|nr:polysaccharide pyruvyl transferase family protein [Rhizobium rhizogenes]PVE55178.1 succinoglycan biosynthesis protein exov [Rhizobium rhizogenes]PVE67732.1 succinoglycan biosynthesis protein exov [Agrobacterium tumefaciens]PVE77509.1 succinoglycan biosynthesis protein exov [Sphingomonas sp. TPD3009]